MLENSNSTLAFDASSIPSSISHEQLSINHMVVDFDTTSQNRNSNALQTETMQESDHTKRFIQSSNDLSINNADYPLKVNENEFSSRIPHAVRVESALLTNDYSELMNPSCNSGRRMTIELNRNQTGAGDENLPSGLYDKQNQTTIPNDQQTYLPLELVSTRDRHSARLAPTKIFLFTFSIILFLVLLCLTAAVFLI